MGQRDQLTVLLCGSGWLRLEVARGSLQDAGHRVLGCGGDRPAIPCRRLYPGLSCPMDDRPVDVVLVLRSRPLPRIEIDEIAALCGLRQEIPLVVGGRTQLNPFGSVATAVLDGSEDVVAACRDAAGEDPAIGVR